MNPLIAPAFTECNILSLGAGVQSSCLALMCSQGEVTPMPNFAIFADTQDEPRSVYEWLSELKKLCNFPIYTVTAGSLSHHALKMRVTSDGRKYSRTNIPFFTKSAKGKVGKIVFRSCTADFKIRPILREVKRRCKVKRGQKHASVTQYIGISWDEWHRCKPSREAWAQSRWPLIELKMTRQHCLDWMKANGFKRPPRSSCVYCPFHSDSEWQRLKTEEPEAFAAAVKFERQIQKAKRNSDNFDSTPFLHRSCVPINEVDFRSDFEKGQMDIFGQGHTYCEEGMCGV